MKTAIPLSLALLLSVSFAAAQPSGQTAPPADVQTVTVMGPREVEQAVHSFVKSYAKPSLLTGKLARWSKSSPLCAHAFGLSPSMDIYVGERIRTVAGMVGTPVDPGGHCKPNMVVLFTPNPQALLDEIARSRTELLGYHYVAQRKSVSRISHPIQAWYGTATRDDNGLTRDDDAAALDACIDSYGDSTSALFLCGTNSRGTRLLDGIRTEMATVLVVVDDNRIAGMQLGALADYTAMLALSQTQNFEACQPLPSITNLMTSGCDASLKPSELSLTDIAFLKALNRSNADFIGALQLSDVARQMEIALGQ